MPELTSTTLGRFCRELAGGLDDLPTLLKEWGIDSARFQALQQSDAFIAEMRVVQAEMAELGNDAGFVYRMKSLSESFLPDFISIFRDQSSSNALKFEMIKWAAEMGRLKEKPAARGVDQVGPRGPTVVFQFGPGLPVQTVTITPESPVQNTENYVLPPAIDVTPEPAANDFWPS